MEARERWNERYAGPGRAWLPPAPAEWLVEHAALLGGGGRALDVACGDGRNALYLAQHGYVVDAIDVSDVAVAALRAAVAERGLATTIAPRVVDLEREPPPPGPYDVIVTLNYLQRDLFGALQDALAPGGVLLYETFGRAHVEGLGRAFNPAYLLDPGELAQAFAGLDVIAQFHGIAERSGAPRGVASLVARKPARPTC